MNKKTAIITGGSSGIGLATAKLLHESGYTVYEFSRRESSVDGIIHITADVTNTAALSAAVKEVTAESDGISLLVCCAGMGVSGAVEFISEEETRRQFEVNLFGTINTVRAVLPEMRKNGGRIICVSSVAAVYAIPYQAYYSASKAAVNAFTDALRNEVKQFGISVTAVMPGDIETGFTAARKKTPDGDGIYGGMISKAVSAMENDERNGMTPGDIAGFIVKLAGKKNVAPLYTVGAQYKTLVFLQRLLPHRLAVYVVGKMYCK